MSAQPDIIYTKVDEAPELASGSFLPIIQSFAKAAGVTVGTKDISLAGRILAQFPDKLKPEQRQPDDLALLGELVEKPDANVIKLPNISASLPQIKGAIAELQSQGYAVPDYPEDPKNDEEKDIKAKYDKVKGSAVNPVLRQGNSDRRASSSVKQYAKKNPHKMGKWTKDSKTHVAHMTAGDFFGNEKSATITEQTAGKGKIEFVAEGGNVYVLKEKLTLNKGDVVDATCDELPGVTTILEGANCGCQTERHSVVLALKATMMKVSDPIMFGHAVTVFFENVFKKHEQTFKELGVNPNNGLGDVLAKIKNCLRQKKRKSRLILRLAFKMGRRLPWSIPTKGLPICMCRAISSLMPPWLRLFGPPAKCGAPMEKRRI